MAMQLLIHSFNPSYIMYICLHSNILHITYVIDYILGIFQIEYIYIYIYIYIYNSNETALS